ncbi:MAG: DNA-directed RNA polymerase subunit omega [Vampirovibrionales bacterium]
MMSGSSSSNTVIPQIAADLCEAVDNRFQLVLQISKVAKHLLEDQRDYYRHDPFQTNTGSNQPEKVIYQALIMKSSEIGSGNELIG